MRDFIEQALADRIKTVRSAIRLKHSLAADNELNTAIDEIKKDFYKSVQGGELPDPIDLKKLVSGK